MSAGNRAEAVMGKRYHYVDDYCAWVTVQVRDTDYRCVVRFAGERRGRPVLVGFPKVLTRAVDSKEARQEAAHAAAAFQAADNEATARAPAGHLDD